MVRPRRGSRGRVDVADRADVDALLRDFYGRAFRDELLGPVFVDVARMDLDAHLPVMCDFWETVLFRAGVYRGNALHPHLRLHARAPLTPAHFARWLTIWRATVDERHAGPRAEHAKLQAARIAAAMSRRITGETPAESESFHEQRCKNNSQPREIGMSQQTTTSTTAESHAGPGDPVRAENSHVIEAIRAHHGELAAALQARTDAVLTAAQAGDCAAARDRLHEWYRAELVPHAAAEEEALYGPAGELDATRLLVDGMLADHRALVGLIADLARAERPFDVAIVAASAQALFTLHLGKENDLLLPALDAAGVDLAAALSGMHDILGAGEETEPSGCGCGCEHGNAAPVQVGAAPADLRPRA